MLSADKMLWLRAVDLAGIRTSKLKPMLAFILTRAYLYLKFERGEMYARDRQLTPAQI